MIANLKVLRLSLMMMTSLFAASLKSILTSTNYRRVREGALTIIIKPYMCPNFIYLENNYLEYFTSMINK